MRRNRIKKRIVAAAAVSAVLLLVFIILGAVSAAMASAMISQKAADIWGADSEIKYAQISCFISVDASYTAERIPQLRASVDAALKEASVSDNTAADARTGRWIDAYSTETRLSARTDRGSADASVTAVGGYFFTLHPMKYISGYAFSPDDIMRDRVVLDTDAAWQLFGSFDIAGQPLTVSGRQCVVAGVVERKNDNVSDGLFDLAYGEKPRIYISYELLDTINPETPVSCYEAVLPSPISGFALDIITENIGVDSADIKIIENSGRYGFFALAETIKRLPVRSMRTNRIIYPYWENIAVVVEDKLALMLLIRIICAVLLLSAAFILILRFIITHPLNKEKLSDYYDLVSGFISRRIPKRKKNKNSADISGG